MITKAQVRQIDSVCGRVELLQSRINDHEVHHYIAKAKNDLLNALRLAERLSGHSV